MLQTCSEAAVAVEEGQFATHVEGPGLEVEAPGGHDYGLQGLRMRFEAAGDRSDPWSATAHEDPGLDVRALHDCVCRQLPFQRFPEAACGCEERQSAADAEQHGLMGRAPDDWGLSAFAAETVRQSDQRHWLGLFAYLQHYTNVSKAGEGASICLIHSCTDIICLCTLSGRPPGGSSAIGEQYCPWYLLMCREGSSHKDEGSPFTILEQPRLARLTSDATPASRSACPETGKYVAFWC